MTQYRSVNPAQIAAFRGKRSRELIAHEMKKRGHATDAKAIWRWENGRNHPNARVLPDLAEVLGCAIGDLYEASSDDEEDASMPNHREMLEALYHAIGASLGKKVAA